MASMMRYTVLSLALLAMLVPTTALNTKYEDLAAVSRITVSIDNVTSVPALSNETDNCPTDGLLRLKGGSDTLTIRWTGANEPHTQIAVKICYVDGDIVDRKWRKYKPEIDLNKQCKQTAEEKDFLESAFDSSATSGVTTVKLSQNTAPARYTIQVLARNETDYTQFGDSSMCFEVYSRENVPTGLTVVMGIFMAISIVFGTAVYAKYRR